MAFRQDTIFRCQYCQKAVTHKSITEGGCPVCHGRRFGVAFSVTDSEMEELVADGYVVDPENWSDKPNVHDAA